LRGVRLANPKSITISGGSIDRQEFFESYEPIWKYQVKNMLQAKQKVRAQRLAAAARTAPNRP